MAEHLPSAAAARPPAPLRDFAGTSRGARHWWRSTTSGRSSPATTHRLRLTGAGLCPRSKGGTASGVGGGGCTDGGGERLEKQPDGVRRSVTAMPAQSSSVILFCILARFHVLAVDDSLVDRKLIEILLKNSSYQVTTVNSGRKVLELLGLRDDAEHASSLSSSSPDPQEIDVNLIITDTACPA